MQVTREEAARLAAESERRRSEGYVPEPEDVEVRYRRTVDELKATLGDLGAQLGRALGRRWRDSSGG